MMPSLFSPSHGKITATNYLVIHKRNELL